MVLESNFDSLFRFANWKFVHILPKVQHWLTSNCFAFRSRIFHSSKADPDPAHRAPPPPSLFENFQGRIKFIVTNKQCKQGAFYSLLSLQKHRVCVKRHQLYFQTSKIIPPGTAPLLKNSWVRQCSYKDATIFGEALTALEQGGIFIVPYLLS